jgi:hypothetical protein
MDTKSIERALPARPDIRSADSLVGGRERLKPSVLAALDRKLKLVGLHLDGGELERLYDLAWQALYARLRDGEWLDAKEAAFEAFLLQVAFRHAVDRQRQIRPRIDQRTSMDIA